MPWLRGVSGVDLLRFRPLLAHQPFAILPRKITDFSFHGNKRVVFYDFVKGIDSGRKDSLAGLTTWSRTVCADGAMT
jgi:hypothetical protein